MEHNGSIELYLKIGKFEMAEFFSRYLPAACLYEHGK
jgi:hypothetical protein